MPQAQTGHSSSALGSKNKKLSVTCDESSKTLYKNYGGGVHTPFVWGDTVTMSGVEVVIASGVEYHGIALATYGTFVATPQSSVGSNSYYIEKDTTNNIVTLKSTGSLSNVAFDVIAMLGVDSTAT